MEDIASLGSSSPSYIPFSNIKNEEYSDIENLLTSDTIEREDTRSYGHVLDCKPSKKKHSEKKKKNVCDNPFMSARMISGQPSTVDKPEIIYGSSDSEDEGRKQTREEEDDVSSKSDSKLSVSKSDSKVDPQKVCDKNSSQKDNKTTAEKIKPVFGRPIKKAALVTKKPKPLKAETPKIKSNTEKIKKIDPPVIDLDDPKLLSDTNQSIIIDDDDEDIFCPSAKVCSKSSQQKNNEEGEQIVPNFSFKKSAPKSKPLAKSPPKKVTKPNSSESIENSGKEKLKKKRSLTEISSAVLNLDHHPKNDSDKTITPPEKKTKTKKRKSKESPEKSDTCSVIKEEHQTSPETTEETGKIPKKKRKKSGDKSSLSDKQEVENNGPVITNIRSLVDNLEQKQNNIEEDLCSDQKDIHPDQKSPTNTDVQVDHEDDKKKKKKKKSKNETPKEENGLNGKPVKKEKKKKKEKPDGNKKAKIEKVPEEVVTNVKVEKMPEVMAPSLDEHLHRSQEIDFQETKDSDSDDEKPEVVSSDDEAESKSPEKPEVESSEEKVKSESLEKPEVESSEKKAKGKSLEKNEVESSEEEAMGESSEKPEVVSSEEKTKNKSSEKSEQQSFVKQKDDKCKKKKLKKDKQGSEEKSKKKCKSSHEKKVRCKKFCMQDREILDTGTWVQCTNSECLKWRFLHDVQDPITVPMLWTCEMNTDSKQNDCSFPEISLSDKDDEENEFIYTKYTEGTVVWARVDGYPWWPGMVEMDPDSQSYFDIETEESMYPKFYHVVFFGKKVSRAWVTVSNIAAFSESKPPPVSKGTIRVRTQELVCAEKLAAKALDLPIKTRLKVFSFSNRYKGSWADCNCHACHKAIPKPDPDSEGERKI